MRHSKIRFKFMYPCSIITTVHMLKAGRLLVLFVLFFKFLFAMESGNVVGYENILQHTAIKESSETSSKNPFERLIFEILTEVVKYLDRASCLQLRSCSKHLLNEYTNTSNTLLLSHLRPKITSGLNCLNKDRLCSTLLLPFAKNLKVLLNFEDSSALLARCFRKEVFAMSMKAELVDLIIEMGASDCFIGFLKKAVYFYNRADKFLGWKLTETVFRLNLLTFEEVLLLSGSDYSFLFLIACRLNLSFIRENLLKFEAHRLNLVNGCNTCIEFDQMTGLEKILQTATNFNYFNGENEDVIALIEASLVRSRFEAVRLLTNTFPSLAQVTSRYIFWAVRAENLTALNFIALNYGTDAVNDNGMNVLELAAQRDYWQGIEVLLRLNQNPSAEVYFNAVIVAVASNSVRSLNLLINEIDRIWSFRDAVERIAIKRLIIQALEIGNGRSLSTILSASPADILTVNIEPGTAASTAQLFELLLDPIRKAIELDFLEGLNILVQFGGIDLVSRRDCLGRTPFLCAAYEGKAKIAKYIAELDPTQVNAVDSDGNNALHLAFIFLKSPMPFVKKIRHLYIDWEQLNKNNLSPIDICLDRTSISITDLELLNELVYEYATKRNK